MAEPWPLARVCYAVAPEIWSSSSSSPRQQRPVRLLAYPRQIELVGWQRRRTASVRIVSANGSAQALAVEVAQATHEPPLVRWWTFRQPSPCVLLFVVGFTLSHREPTNHDTYVDIDPAVRGIAGKHFLRAAARGNFIADDARRFVIYTEQRFAAAIVDAYGSHSSIPGHLVTPEFWQATRRVLEPDWLLIANLILDSAPAMPYSRNLLAIESVDGRCAVAVLQKKQVLANAVVTCRNEPSPKPVSLLVDERNRADFDLARSC